MYEVGSGCPPHHHPSLHYGVVTVGQLSLAVTMMTRWCWYCRKAGRLIIMMIMMINNNNNNNNNNNDDDDDDDDDDDNNNNNNNNIIIIIMIMSVFLERFST